MLSPSIVTVRRPSSTADLILSRTDSLLVGDARCIKTPGDRPSDNYQQTHLLPSGGTHSAPLSASPSACWTGGATPAASGSECSRPSTPSTSPEARKRYWRRQLLKLKEEMDRVGDGFRRSVRGSIDTLATRLSPSTRGQWRNGYGGGGGELLLGNGFSVEIVRETRRQRTKSADRSRNSARHEESCSGAGGDGCSRIYDYKLPSTLVLTGLCDGAFSGEIALDTVSPAQSVTIQIRDYRLEFYVPGDHATVDQPARPHFVGAVSLPIYVDPGSLMFRLSSSDMDGGVHQLLVDGRMKGCSAGVTDVGPRRLSVSATDLRLPKSRSSERPTTLPRN